MGYFRESPSEKRMRFHEAIQLSSACKIGS